MPYSAESVNPLTYYDHDLTQGIDHERIRQIATGVMRTMTQFFNDKTAE